MASTTNGGRSDGSPAPTRSARSRPSCVAFTYTPSPCDPTPRFIAPFDNDVHNLSHWVAGGEFVWDNGGKGWDTTVGDGVRLADRRRRRGRSSRRSRQRYVRRVVRSVQRAGFSRGIARTRRYLAHVSSNLPNRFVNALTVDPANASHVYAVFNGFSRRWTNTAASATSSRPATAAAPGPTSVATSRTSRATT